MPGTAEHVSAGRHTLSCARPIRVMHVITTLDTGGAEMMLLKLLGTIDRARFRSSVVTLSGAGVIAPMLRAIGVPVTALNLRPKRVVRGVWRLGSELRRARPDIVQTWMYHADLLGSLAALALPDVPVVWNIRCGRLDKAIHRSITIWASRACALASRNVPARILSCSQASVEAHVAAGYARAKLQVIPNGFDTAVFRPDPLCRRAIRDELGLGADKLLGGLIARYDRTKDHATFCEAARIVCGVDPRIHFVLCGEGVTPANPDLVARMAASGIAHRCHLLGRRDDIPRIMAGLDFAVLSSVIEGFPNVLGEAMSCGIPCVATDTGDSRMIVGETGFIVPVRDPAALAEGIINLVRMDASSRSMLGRKARQRIIEQFGLAAVTRRYELVYEELASGCAA